MEWNEEATKKSGVKLSSIILIIMIICIVIIVLLMMLLLSVNNNKQTIVLNGKINNDIKKEELMIKIDGVTYINIEKFASLVEYEFHNKEEYKTFVKEDDKCYVKGKNETVTFYLNDDKICKLPVDKLTEDYREYDIKYTVKEQNGNMYADIEAIKLAFNVTIKESEKSLEITTLDEWVEYFDEQVKLWGYSGISNQIFENQKSILYGYLIVNKDGGKYKIVDTQNKVEIVSDKYNLIEFSENTKEFFVTNSLGQVGIINLDGSTKIEPAYNSIEILDKKSNLYLVQKNRKYGVIKSGNSMVLSCEYDKIGLSDKTITGSTVENQYLILDTFIPVCKNNKWGLVNKEGELIFDVVYDALGCSIETIEVNKVKKTVKPVLVIERCNGIVVKKNDKYGLIDITGKELIQTSCDCIYTLENNESKYFMLYNEKEFNIIDTLVNAGIIKLTDEEKEEKKTIENNNINNSIMIENSVGIENNIMNN